MRVYPCPYCNNEDRNDNANAIRKGAKGNCKRTHEAIPPCLGDASGVHTKKAKAPKVTDRISE